MLLKAQQGELDAVLMYRALADTVKSEADAEVFRRLAAEEGGHAAVFKALTGATLKPKNQTRTANGKRRTAQMPPPAAPFYSRSSSCFLCFAANTP